MIKTKAPGETGANDLSTTDQVYSDTKSETSGGSEASDTPIARLPDPVEQTSADHKGPEKTSETTTPKASSEEHETLRDSLVKMVLDAGCELFHDRNGNTFATVPQKEHHETWRLRSDGFRRWLRHQWLELTGHGVGTSAISDVLDTLDAKAAFSQELAVHIRIAHCENGIYVDLCDNQWRAVHITAAGWSIVSDPPVRFLRTKGMLPLPAPILGGRISDLRPLINAPTEEVWCLIVAWILAAFSAGPFPILVLLGEQGSAKSFLCRVLRQLIDPSEVEVTSTPKDSRDVMMAAQNSHVVALDNLSGVLVWLSDLLCSIATGVAHRERKYHTNNGEEELFKARRPILLNGIDFALRDDLLSRSFLVTLPMITDDKRQDESDLWAAINMAAPSVLGGIFDTLSSILKYLPTTKLATKPRMADVALWVTAAETALGWKPGQFVRIYGNNRNQSAELALESDSFGLALRDYISQKPDGRWLVGWQTLVTALSQNQTPAGWPKNSKAVATRLTRLAPALRHVGIRWTRERQDCGKRYYLIEMDVSDVANVAMAHRDSNPADHDLA